MGLRKMPYTDLHALLCDFMTDEEDEHTKRITELVASELLKGGSLTQKTFLEIGYWKSPRVVPKMKKNRAVEIPKLTSLAYHENDLARKTAYLLKLQGVDLTMASSILMFFNPNKYGVIDPNIWQVLYQLGTIDGHSNGQSLTIQDYEIFTLMLQNDARDLGTTLQQISEGLSKAYEYYHE